MFNFKKLLYLLLLIILITPSVFAQEYYGNRLILQGIWNGQQVEYVDGQISIKTNEGANEEDVITLLAQYDATLVEDFDVIRWGLVEVREGTDIFSIIEELLQSNLIENAEPNMIARADFEPDDPYYLDGHQWALKNTGQSPPGGTNDADIDAPEAWDITLGNSDIIISILDTGIPLNINTLNLCHPDLDDPNKFILGPDFINDLYSVRDFNGHGTHVTGIASAETNNQTGIAGVAGACMIMVIQVLDGSGNGSFLDFKNGVIWAVDHNAKIINYSAGGRQSLQAEDAVKYAYEHNVFITAAAGNTYGQGVGYPAGFSSHGTYPGFENGYGNVTCISATDHNDQFSSYSSKGPEVNVSAPGGYGGPTYDADDIFSTTPNYPFNLEPFVTRNYGYLYGTSMAAPHVAGIAGLILSVNPDLSALQIRDIIEQSADDKGVPGKDEYYGWGRVNAYQAVLLGLAYANKSVSYDATAHNNNHILERGYFGKLHEVFHGGGEIFYRRSSNNGTNWELTTRISNGNDFNNHPSIVASGLGAKDFLCLVWQRKINNLQYEIYTAYSSDSGTSWSETFNPVNVTVSSSQSNEGGGPGTTPVVASYQSGGQKYLLVYATESGLYYRTASFGNDWSGATLIPGSYGLNSTIWYPSIATYNNQSTQVNLIYDDRFTHVYSQIFNGTSWANRIVVDWIGSYNRTSSIAVDNTNKRLGVWCGWDGTNFVTRFRQGYSDGTWSHWCKQWSAAQGGINFLYPSVTYYKKNTPYPYGIDILWNTSGQEIRQKTYSGLGDNWIPADPNTQLIATSGLFANLTHERENTTKPLQIWTDESIPPIFQILYNSDYLPKGGLLADGEIRRAAEIADTSNNSYLRIELSEPVITLTNGDEIKIPFKSYNYSDTLELSTENVFDYLQTELVNIPNNAQSVTFKVDINASQPDTLSDGTLNTNPQTPFRTINFGLLAKDDSSNILLNNIGNLLLGNLSGIHHYSREFTVSALALRTRNIRVIPNINLSGTFNHNNLHFTLVNVSIEGDGVGKDSPETNENIIPTEFSLEQNYPNPFNPVTQIRYSVIEDGLVTLKVYDVLGREVVVLVNEEKTAGTYTINFNASILSSGVYFYQLKTKDFVNTKKMILLK